MVQELDYTKFVFLHEVQLLSSGVPRHFWPILYIKLKNQIFDSNEAFSLLKIDYEHETRSPEEPLWLVEVDCEEGLKKDDKKHIYLIDHAWTFQINHAKQQLLEMKSLSERMCNIMGINENSDEGCADKICSRLWKYCQTYSIGNAESIEDRLPVWYVMDELGCGIQHSDDPNFRAVPFVYIPEQITYNLIFPIKDLEYKERVTRDFVEGVQDAMKRKAQLLPWIKTDFTHFDFTQEEPSENYFVTGHIKESLPKKELEIQMPHKIKVFSEYSLVNQFLTDDRFQIVDKESEADILWLTRHFKTYAELNNTPNKFVNQFPYENVLTIKDLLSIICRRKSGGRQFNSETLDTFPVWVPTTYNLRTELCKFVSYYQNREKVNLDNHWICKPWNLARSLDTHVTNNLDFIVRLPLTGPKIAQKYVHNPVLFYRSECGGKVKFDIRYVLLLKSVRPLKAYVYNNFFLRFSNKPFELTDFDDYEKHFTVMNYSDECKLHHLPCADFLKEWDTQYPNLPWRDIEQRVLLMLREMLEAATEASPPKGIAESPQSRAVYAVDIMLSWEVSSLDKQIYSQPKLLEVNWTPDCKRACDYYNNFYNDIFNLLFCDKENIEMFTCL